MSKCLVVFVFLCFIQLSEDYDCPAGPCPDRREREEEAKTAGAAGMKKMKRREGGEEDFYHLAYYSRYFTVSSSSSERSRPKWRSSDSRRSEKRQGGDRKRRRKRGGWRWRERCWRGGTSWTHWRRGRRSGRTEANDGRFFTLVNFSTASLNCSVQTSVLPGAAEASGRAAKQRSHWWETSGGSGEQRWAQLPQWTTMLKYSIMSKITERIRGKVLIISPVTDILLYMASLHWNTDASVCVCHY